MYVCMYICTVCMYVCMYVCICMNIILHFTLLSRKPRLCRGRTMVLYAEGPRFKSPVCTKELCASFVFRGGVGDPIKVERKFPTTFCNM